MLPAILRIVRLSAAFAAALNGTMVMPLIVLALNRIPGIDETTATLIASAEIGGIALYCLIWPRLVHRARRRVVGAGVVALVLGELASHVLVGAAPLAVARLLAGLGEGALFSLITSEVAAEASAERIWGQINVLGGVCMGLLLYGLSTLAPVAGRGPIFLWLAGFAALMAPLILQMPAKARDTGGEHAPISLQRRTIATILFVVLLVYAVQAAQWAVSGYVGERAHIPGATVGLFLSLSSILGFIGAVAPSLTRNPAWRLPLVTLGFLIMAGALYAFFSLMGNTPFLYGQILVNVGFYMVTPFVTGLLTEYDPDGALVLRTLVVALIGAAVGTALAGFAFEASGPGRFGLMAVATVAVAFVCAITVFRHTFSPRQQVVGRVSAATRRTPAAQPLNR
jgi:predicted MFS family arabinose efflux permease